MQVLDNLINAQIDIGAANSELEAEEMTLEAVEKRALDLKLVRAQQQIKNGEYFEATDQFIDDLLQENQKNIIAKSSRMILCPL